MDDQCLRRWVDQLETSVKKNERRVVDGEAVVAQEREKDYNSCYIYILFLIFNFLTVKFDQNFKLDPNPIQSPALDYQCGNDIVFRHSSKMTITQCYDGSEKLKHFINFAWNFAQKKKKCVFFKKHEKLGGSWIIAIFNLTNAYT